MIHLKSKIAILKFIKKITAPFVLSLISALTYRAWLFPGIFTHSDWSYYFLEAQKGRLFPSMWISNIDIGSMNLNVWHSPYEIFHGLLGALNLGVNIDNKILVYLPIIFLLPIASYFFIRTLRLNRIAGFVGACVIVLNTYFLSIATPGDMLLTAASIFGILSIAGFIILNENFSAPLLLFTILNLFLTGAYDFRIAYMAIFLIAAYYLFNLLLSIKSYVPKFGSFVLIGFVFVLVNLYWIIPSLISHSLVSNAVLDRGLFGNNFWSLTAAFSLFHPFWTGGAVQWFVVHQIPPYFWFVPLFAFGGLLLNRKNKHVLFFGLIALLGIFLSKEVDQPFATLYPWLFEHFPGFNAFREASKFYILITIGYSVLIAAFIDWIWKKWTFNKIQIFGKYLLTAAIVWVFLWNIKPFITGEIGTVFVPRQIPNDYLALKDFISNQSSYFRTYWIPTASPWSVHTNLHPEVKSVDQSSWWNLSQVSSSAMLQDQIVSMLHQPFSRALFDTSSIKYVIVPAGDIANDADPFSDYGGAQNPNIQQWYVDQINQVGWLKKIDIGTKNLGVYENENYRPHIYTTAEPETIYKDVPYESVSSVQINPTEYTVHLSNIRAPAFVNFSDNFDTNWKIRVGSFAWDEAFGADYFLPDKFHSESDATLNSFYIDPNYIRQNLPASAYKINSDGSMDLDLTIYFKPQSYFYVGLIISAVTLFICLGYLGWALVRKRKRKEPAAATRLD